MELTDSQYAALDALTQRIAMGDSLVTLSGAAGTGKTTLIRALVDRYPHAVVCTPTNKAAQVLQSKGLDATTFYKRFYILEEVTGGRPSFISCRRWLDGGRSSLPPNKMEHAPILVIDEASMVTSKMVREMQTMCDVLVLVGDHHQLPPVNDYHYPAGLFGTLKPTAQLTEIMRQAEGSKILDLASALRDTNRAAVDAQLRHFQPDQDFVDLVKGGAQVIAYTNRERIRVNHVCRKILGFEEMVPSPGDRMVVTNNYSEELINGTTVVVESFEWDTRLPDAFITVTTEGAERRRCRYNMLAFMNDQIAVVRDTLAAGLVKPITQDADTPRLEAAFAYCITAHKAQGSEWDSVIVLDQRSVVFNSANNRSDAGLPPDEAVRRWTYTAVTRARKQLTWAPCWFAQSYASGF